MSSEKGIRKFKIIRIRTYSLSVIAYLIVRDGMWDTNRAQTIFTDNFLRDE